MKNIMCDIFSKNKKKKIIFSYKKKIKKKLKNFMDFIIYLNNGKKVNLCKSLKDYSYIIHNLAINIISVNFIKKENEYFLNIINKYSNLKFIFRILDYSSLSKKYNIDKIKHKLKTLVLYDFSFEADPYLLLIKNLFDDINHSIDEIEDSKHYDFIIKVSFQNFLINIKIYNIIIGRHTETYLKFTGMSLNLDIIKISNI
ncbi:hypothetical protein (nucleomorph) [Guillardia theta]|uniref:Brix domain-containing protein n=1 Tax=Guillardia theta TaxID=55529 RepID=Q98SD2_GUITH|nr:hypothetical protein GTHECHR3008 [Guillardia theta]AAK39652.1 hypothetical protein [Guillardia theta]